MSKKVGLPEFVKSRHDSHFVEEISTRTRTAIIRNIPVEKIMPNVMQPRKDMGDLEELADSIREKGIIEPIIVRTKDGMFEIIAGERRFRAAQMAELEEVPCIEHDVPDNEALELAIVENLQRKDLNLFEAAYSLKSLAEIYGYTHEDIARKIGKSRVTVTELLRITDMPAEIASRCIELGITSKTFIQELVKLADREQMNAVLDRYQEEPFSREVIKAQRKAAPEKSRRTAAGTRKKFNFVSEDRSVKINFSIAREEFKKDKIITILEHLIEDIRQGKIKDI